MTLFENEPALTGHQFKIKGGKLWTLTQAYYDELKDTYPLHDVEGCMREAKLWCKKVSASKRKTAKGMQRFLMGWVSRSEATGHVTVDPEKTPSEITYEKNLRSHIEQWKNVIHEWTPGKLKSNKRFMAASQYPEFATWALEQRPDLKGAKPDHIVSVNKKVEPPKPEKKQIKRLVMPSKRERPVVIAPAPDSSKTDRILKLYRDVVKHRDKTIPLLK